MEDWQLDFEWLKVRHWIRDRFKTGSLPDFRAILFLIGVREVGRIKQEYSKEEKQDLMHVATCTLLCQENYFEFKGLDTENWPHFDQVKSLPYKGVVEEERYLKEQIIYYFNNVIQIKNEDQVH